MRAAVRRLMQTDRAGGGLRTLEEYRRLFDGYGAIVDEEFRTLAPAAAGATRVAGPEDRPPDPPAPAPGAASDFPWPEYLPAAETIGPYRVVRELGRGGMGVVYEARDSRLPRHVALKVLSPQFAMSPDLRLRFHREAQLAARLDHPHICTVYEAGEDNGAPFLAMRFVEGRPLADHVASTRERADATGFVHLPEAGERDGEAPSPSGRSRSAEHRREIDRVLLLFERAARALHHAHGKGLIHRDIKPHNIMVTPEGEPVLLDFGLAREESGEGQHLTKTGALLGTPAYMSPEQFAPSAGGALDRRTDVYSLGASLYECLTLRRPYEAPTFEALYARVLTEEPEDPRRLNPAVSRDLQVVVATAMERDRDRRYRTAEDLAEELHRIRKGLPILARPVGPVGRLARWARRRPALAASLAFAFVALASGLGVSLRLLDEARRQSDAKSAALDEVARERDAKEAQRALAEEARRRSEGLRLAALAVPAIEKDGSLGLLLAAEAAARAPGAESLDALYAALAAEQEVRRLLGHDKYVLDGAWSPDGGRVATFEEGFCVILWDAGTGAPLRRLLHDRALVLRVAFDPGGGLLATCASDGSVRVWDAKSGTPCRTLPAHAGPAGAMEWSPEGGTLATGGDDGTVSLWAAATGERRAILRGQGGAVSALAWSADGGRLASLGADGAVRIWDGSSRVLLREFRAGPPGEAAPPSRPGMPTDTVAFAAGARRLFTWTSRGILRVLDLEAPADVPVLEREEVVRLSVSGDGRRIALQTLAVPDRLELTDLEGTGAPLEMAIPAGFWLWALDCDGRRALLGSKNFVAATWDLERGRPVATLAGHAYTLKGARWSPDGSRILTCAADGTARIWAAEPRGCVRLPVDVSAERIARDGRRWVETTGPLSATSVRVVVRDGSGAAPDVAVDVPGPILRVRWCRAEPLVAVEAETGQRILDPATGGTVLDLRYPGDIGPSSRDPNAGWSLAQFNDRRDRAWLRGPDHAVFSVDVATGGIVRGPAPDRCNAFRVSPDDGRVLVLEGPAKKATIWGVSPPRLEHVLPEQGGMVLNGAWTSDGRRVATAAMDMVVRVWDAATGTCIARAGPVPGFPMRVDFGNGDRWLLVEGAGQGMIFETDRWTRVATLVPPAGEGEVGAAYFDEAAAEIVTVSKNTGVTRRWPFDPLAEAARRLPVETPPDVVARYDLLPPEEQPAQAVAWHRRHSGGRGLAGSALQWLRAGRIDLARELAALSRERRPDLGDAAYVTACIGTVASADLPAGPARDAALDAVFADLHIVRELGAWPERATWHEPLLAPLHDDPRWKEVAEK